MPVYSGQLDVAPDTEGISSLGASFGERFSSSLAETTENLPTVGLIRAAKMQKAAGETSDELGFPAPGGELTGSLGDPDTIMHANHPDIPDVPIDEARRKVKDAKLDQSIKLPAQDTIKQPVLDMMIEHAQQQRERQTTIARGPQGFLPGALDVGTSFLVGALDPINIAAFSIPVLGEARYAKLLASAGESVLGRAAVRGGTGAAAGAVGSTALLPTDYYIHTQDGQDFTMASALESIIMGAGTGGLIHATGFPLNIRGGVFGEAYRAVRGRPLDLEPPAVRAQENVAEPASVAETAPDNHVASERAVVQNAIAEHDAVVDAPMMSSIDDLPPRAKEDTMHGAVANLIEGDPVRVGEMLAVAGNNDPRIAESFEAAPIATDTEVSQTVSGKGEARSLLQFIRSRGGLQPDAELTSIFGRNKLDIIRNDGMTLDQAREAAVEAGYLHDEGAQSGGVTESTVNHLLDALDNESRGNKVYPAGEEGPKIRDRELDRIDGEITAGFQELGQDAKTIPKPIRDRTAHIMYTEGVTDPIAAYERAVMEADYYAEKQGKIERIAGNELPAETRSAQGPSPEDQGARRAGGPSATARQPSADDSRTSDAEWQRLARGPDNDAAIALSQEVAKLPEPFSMIATKSRAAAEQMAAEIEERFKALEEGGLIPEEARKQIGDIVLKAKQHEVDWSEAVKSGISCLAAGAAGAVV